MKIKQESRTKHPIPTRLTRSRLKTINGSAVGTKQEERRNIDREVTSSKRGRSSRSVPIRIKQEEVLPPKVSTTIVSGNTAQQAIQSHTRIIQD